MSDTIDRQAAIDYFVTNVGFHDEDGYPIEDECELREIWTGYFDGIPSAQPESLVNESRPLVKDTISRQAAINKILGQPPEPHYPSWYAEQIKELPPAQPEILACGEGELNIQFESHWIPVTERLPEVSGCYLVSVKNDHERRYSKTAWFEKGAWFARQDVIAWMPLPEPYKEVIE